MIKLSVKCFPVNEVTVNWYCCIFTNLLTKFYTVIHWVHVYAGSIIWFVICNMFAYYPMAMFLYWCKCKSWEYVSVFILLVSSPSLHQQQSTVVSINPLPMFLLCSFVGLRWGTGRSLLYCVDSVHMADMVRMLFILFSFFSRLITLDTCFVTYISYLTGAMILYDKDMNYFCLNWSLRSLFFAKYIMKVLYVSS